MVIIAEEHRDEFRAVAQYLNDLAEYDNERGIAVWLVEARAVRIGDSAWAPLFTAVVEPNSFTATVEQAKQSEVLGSLEDFWSQFESPDARSAAQTVLSRWLEAGYRRRLGPNHVVLYAAGPSKDGWRTVVAVYSDGRVMVPFGSYAGQNTGIPIEPLTTTEFRATADRLFGFNGSERLARTAAGWLNPDRAEPLVRFCFEVAKAYAVALESSEEQRGNSVT